MVTRVAGDSKFKKGRRGLAELVRLNAEMVRIDFEKTEKEDAQSFNLKVSYGEDGTIPEYVPVKKMKDGAKIRVSATMNEGGDALLFAVPASGEFDAKLDKFNAPEGQEPVAETKPGRKAGTSYKTFGVLIEITSGVWKGAKYYYSLYPNFAADEDGNLAVSGTGSGSDALFDFMEATGVAEQTFPFSENPLPAIQRLAKELDRQFRIIVAKGWIDRIVAPLNEEDAFETDFPEPELSEAQKANVTTHPALNEDQFDTVSVLSAAGLPEGHWMM